MPFKELPTVSPRLCNDFPIELPLFESYYVPTMVEFGNNDEEEVLIWNADARHRKVRPGSGLLHEFIKLHTRPKLDYLKFARKWGVLDTCWHGLPRKHYLIDAVPHCDSKQFSGSWNYDLICDWWLFSRGAQAILELVSNLNYGKVDLDWWKALYPPVELPKSLTRAGLMLQMQLSRWLAIGGVSLRPQWKPETGQWVLSFTTTFTPSLFGAIAARIMLAIVEQPGLTICSSCKKFYSPSRRPNPNRRNYCQKCAPQAAWRDSKRQQRTRLSPGESRPAPDDAHSAAALLGRRGGKKGGPARAAKLSPKERSRIAKQAAETRWRKK